MYNGIHPYSCLSDILDQQQTWNVYRHSLHFPLIPSPAFSPQRISFLISEDLRALNIQFSVLQIVAVLPGLVSLQFWIHFAVNVVNAGQSWQALGLSAFIHVSRVNLGVNLGWVSVGPGFAVPWNSDTWTLTQNGFNSVYAVWTRNFVSMLDQSLEYEIEWGGELDWSGLV